jgi:Spy/CpxP family protein refolding chaperone
MSLKIRSLVTTSLILASLAVGGAALAHGGGHGGHGASARSLPSLTQDQKTKLDAAADAEHKARADLRVALAGQVDKGTIDRNALKPQIDAAKLAEANARKVEADTLTAAQKAELAKLREAKRAEHEANKGKHAGDAKGEHHDHAGKGLNLTPEQKAQIKARMAAEPTGDRGAERIVDRIDATVPVLTPAQRAELSAKLRRQ